MPSQTLHTPLPAGARIAVVGSGISGLGVAWLLARRYRVSLFERNSYHGGHTNTVPVPTREGTLPVDTGFIVYNERNYPHLTALFRHLRIATRPTDMSFAASIDGGQVEYAGSSLNTLFAQRRNLANPRFHRMLLDILRFNRAAGRLAAGSGDSAMSLGDFLLRGGYGSAFRDHYLLPMAAAIWSCPSRSMLEFPALSLARFFANHGLLDLSGRPRWRTVAGGGRRYVERLLEAIGPERHLDTAVRSLRRGERGVTLCLADGREAAFDGAVIATHADQALALLERPDPRERRLLGAFGYQDNRALLHTDPALMPRLRRVWSAWNYLGDTAGPAPAVSVTYWMNPLQSLPGATDYFVSLNPLREPDPGRLLREIHYRHPVFDGAALAAQSALGQIQGGGRVWFCGSYCGYGFHEDGLRSAVEVARGLGVEAPWNGTATAAAPARLPVPGLAGEAA